MECSGARQQVLVVAVTVRNTNDQLQCLQRSDVCTTHTKRNIEHTSVGLVHVAQYSRGELSAFDDAIVCGQSSRMSR